MSKVTGIFRTAAITTAMLALAGCEYARVVAFDGHELSGSRDPYDVRLGVVGTPGKASSPALPRSARSTLGAESFSDLYRETLERECSVDAPKATGRTLVAPLIGFAVDQFIGGVSSALQSRADELKESSQKTYATSILLKPEEFPVNARGRCIVVERVAKADDGAVPAGGLALAFRLTPVGATGSVAMTPEPVYAELRKALALTASDRGVSLVIALGARVARMGENGPAVGEVALGSFTIPNLTIGKPKFDFDNRAGGDLIAQIPDGWDALELTVAVVETGSAIPDADRAKAEVKALQAAIGPKLRDALLAGL